MRELAKTADVVIENLKFGDMRRYRLDYERCNGPEACFLRVVTFSAIEQAQELNALQELEECAGDCR